MNRKAYWLSPLLVLALAPWTNAMADGYWIRLKDANGALVSGVTGGFSYNKTTQIATQGVCQEGTAVVVNVNIPANALGTQHPALEFNTNVVVQKPLICRTQSFKEISGRTVPAGTKQCLDNGTNVSGVNGTLKTKSGQYTLQFHSTPANILASNGCATNAEPTYNRNFTITGPNGFNVSNTYWVVNNVHAVPEPGSLSLLLAGLCGGLGLLWWSRGRGAGLTR